MTIHIIYDEELIKYLEKIIILVQDMKTRFDHVRGDVESRELMVLYLERAIEIIKQKEV
tara:strand:- start:12286 stop:12462 length:177 start_codon:yes stop_codon:yes gene_type:complete